MASSSLLSNAFDPAESSSQSLLTLRESEYGSGYTARHEPGVFLSSLALTVITASVATIAILLITFIIILALLLASCDGISHQTVLKSVSAANVSHFCHAFKTNSELNNIQGWLVPRECEGYVYQYLTMGEYQKDLHATLDAARQYLAGLSPELDGLDVVIMDIDDTALSNLPYFIANGLGSEKLDQNAWNQWIMEAKVPAIYETLHLYKEIKAANWGVVFITKRLESTRTYTEMNLHSAGYEDWRSLIMRSEGMESVSVGVYKARQRLELEGKGYRIHATIGDQWSDFKGPASGRRNFKLPNLIYYTD